MASSFNCPNCSGPLDFENLAFPTIRCPYCHTSVIVPEELRAKTPISANFSTGKNPIQQTALKEKLDFISEAARVGNKLVAIRALRDSFPITLKQAAELVDAMQCGEQVDLQMLQSLAPILAAWVMPKDNSPRPGRLPSITWDGSTSPTFPGC